MKKSRAALVRGAGCRRRRARRRRARARCGRGAGSPRRATAQARTSPSAVADRPGLGLDRFVEQGGDGASSASRTADRVERVVPRRGGRSARAGPAEASRSTARSGTCRRLHAGLLRRRRGRTRALTQSSTPAASGSSARSPASRRRAGPASPRRRSRCPRGGSGRSTASGSPTTTSRPGSERLPPSPSTSVR